MRRPIGDRLAHGWQSLSARLRHYREAPLDAVERQQIGNILAHSHWFALWLLFLFGLACVALWGQVPTLWLLLFLIVFGLEVAIKISISQHYRNLDARAQSSPSWRLVFDAGSVYSGLVYGAAALVLFHPLNELSRWLLIGIFSALVISLAAGTALYTPVVRIMLPCLMMPLTLALLLSGEPTLLLLAMLCLATLAGVITLARSVQQHFRDLVDRNRDMLARLASLGEQQRMTAEQQARAEQAVIDKSRFLAIASHDLRQPLHAIGLFQHALRMKSENDENRQLFESIDRSTVALNAMFDSLLDVSKLDARVLQPEFESVELEGLCSVMNREFAPMAQKKGLRFHCELMPARLVTDGTLLARILRNLIGNAVKFTEHGEVTLQSQVHADRLVITISDTGPGIPAAERRKVFSEFYQVAGSELVGTEGVGLGLSIVWRLCELLDIRIHLDASPSGGTRVTLTMSCEPEPTCRDGAFGSGASVVPDEQPQGVSAAIDAGQCALNGHAVDGFGEFSSGTLAGRRILILDDDPQIRQAMSDTLSQWGCQAICEADVSAALQRIQTSSAAIDLLVCDYQLSGDMDGIAAVAALRKSIGNDLPAILISGACGTAATQRLAVSGFPCLVKPVSASRLQRVIEQQIQASSQETSQTSR